MISGEENINTINRINNYNSLEKYKEIYLNETFAIKEDIDELIYDDGDTIILTVDMDIGTISFYKETVEFDTITVDTLSEIIEAYSAIITLPNSLQIIGTKLIPINFYAGKYIKIENIEKEYLIIESNHTSITIDSEIKKSIPIGTFFSIYISIHTSHNITSEIYNKGME